MKITEQDNNGYLIESDRGLFHVCLPQVHNFQISRDVLLLEGEKRRPRKVGLVLGGAPQEDLEAFAEKILEADRERDRTWVISLPVQG